MGVASPANGYVERQLYPEVISIMGPQNRALRVGRPKPMLALPSLSQQLKACPAMFCSFV